MSRGGLALPPIAGGQADQAQVADALLGHVLEALRVRLLGDPAAAVRVHLAVGGAVIAPSNLRARDEVAAVLVRARPGALVCALQLELHFVFGAVAGLGGRVQGKGQAGEQGESEHGGIPRWLAVSRRPGLGAWGPAFAAPRREGEGGEGRNSR